MKAKQKEDNFLKDGGELLFFNSDWRPIIEIEFIKPREKDAIPSLEINVEDFITVKGFKALGNQITAKKIKNITLKEVIPFEEETKVLEEIEVTDQEEVNGTNPKLNSTLNYLLNLILNLKILLL